MVIVELNRLTIFFLFVILINGCIEPFEPDIDEPGSVLVIDGYLTDAPVTQTISISRSSPYKNPQFFPVTGCVVRVEDELGDGIIFLEDTAGIYRSELEPGFMAVGKAYKLTVFTPDDEVYESDYDSLLACTPIDSLCYRIEVQGTSDPDINYYGIRFYSDTKGNPEDARNYMWTFEETWEYTSYYRVQYSWNGSSLHDFITEKHGVKVCYLTEELKAYEVGSSRFLGRNEIHQQPLYFVSNLTPRLQEQYSLLVVQHSLSNAAFLYWEKMKAQSNDDYKLYDVQPSRATGNIYNSNHPEEKVLGYFFVSQVKEKRITVNEDFDFPIAPFSCPLDTILDPSEELGADYPYFLFSVSSFGRGPPYAFSYQECHDCTYRGGVTVKPEFFDK